MQQFWIITMENALPYQKKKKKKKNTLNLLEEAVFILLKCIL
jgi:hypothetical protein